ncbi:hypothetical protein NY99_16965 [Xanthomonas phaseoli pv. phaseoli]|uniref:Uncharacterized protein n=2 Tax=Xanthomonas TaxID=338 RepID=A0AA45BV69_XANCM|nr:hypothetical protein XAC29_00985 [Xanthomonas axonopodis Xac29-1]AKM23471.1 hypothetical protein AB890_00990 [Xanthomonas citri pv. citri]AOL18040.1 hypothetical protein BGK55_00960 [Xanthomonas citri pv. malvacearum]EKQ65740.1 hypothetical protein MOU_03954 [Xanthomonas citri pv. malvacearum str. GSPB1386]KGU53139.1 hypothetical protein NY99_16965 [Xanthomonas phaseoli pv. phaseoli]NMI12715.1 hypothetical protein [Xanthomonas citri]OOW64305.1 hypothetical protein Xmlh_21415 [Xanthomonas a
MRLFELWYANGCKIGAMLHCDAAAERYAWTILRRARLPSLPRTAAAQGLALIGWRSALSSAVPQQCV